MWNHTYVLTWYTESLTVVMMPHLLSHVKPVAQFQGSTLHGSLIHLVIGELCCIPIYMHIDSVPNSFRSWTIGGIFKSVTDKQLLPGLFDLHWHWAKLAITVILELTPDGIWPSTCSTTKSRHVMMEMSTERSCQALEHYQSSGKGNLQSHTWMNCVDVAVWAR